MEDLDVNPLYQAFLCKFRREFDIACRMSYLIVVPHSDTLGECDIDQHFAAAHILMPSNLLKAHYNPLQAGQSYETAELDGKRLVCKRVGRDQKLYPVLGHDERALVVRILAEDVAYNASSREFRTLLVDRPLVVRAGRPRQQPAALLRTLLGPLGATPELGRRSLARPRPPNCAELASHDDCFAQLERISLDLTHELESDIRRLQSTYLVLADYLEDAAERLRELAARYAASFERAAELCYGRALDQAASHTILLAVEGHVMHLMHGKLMVAVHEHCARNDQLLLDKLGAIWRTRLTPGQLGARDHFAHFEPSDQLLQQLRRLPTLQSPISVVSGLLRIVELVSTDLERSIEFGRLIGSCSLPGQCPVSICSDDLIVALVHALVRARPQKLCSLVKYLELFGSSATSRDQAGYFAATLQIVVQYVLDSEPHERRPDSAKPCQRPDPSDDESSETNSDRLASLEYETFADDTQ